ncbi:carboxypeptidase-like regulatory domain-containing protein [Flavobacterium sasangense]|uniref:carboxypeptidase-like regulatory domain-containing protein n=1 Tax=Flavobacterium sasangense TaxID=503361 RepID=UPI000478B75B|nr:carboxypeptidase-like regulatory domain-containing protein [Flavobacterium sasangense]
MKKLFWLIIFINNTIYSQTIIKGTIFDNSNKPVPNSSVLILKKGTDDVIAYAISDSKGIYSITFSSSYNEIDIQVRCMSYETITETIKNNSNTKNFILNEKSFELKEIIVKTSPIKQKGDTIKYFVNSFSKEQDRSIGDVLKRMPGIEVLSDGKILYQGRPINKYYIEGLDLLEGKYNLANENLPFKEVTQVQILENHQPIRALDSLKFSDQAALNIKLKNAYTFTGQASLGSGFNPLLWDANITPMLFTKKTQMLATYQTNNTGVNVASQLKKLTIEDLINQFENNSEKTDWLSIQQLATPNFSEKRWLDNNIHLLSGNYLQKLNNNYELRINLSYLNDYQQQKGYTNTEFITPVNTITILEEKYNQSFYNSLQTNITLQKNADKNYFKNSLEFQGFWDSQKGNIVLNNEPINQQLNNEFFRISNNLKNIFPLGKQMITLNSYVGLNKTPQTLTVNPGQFENILNNNLPYDEVKQQVDLNTFYTNNSISFTKAIKRFSIEPKVGFQIENQQLNSEILTSENFNLGNEFSNNLDWFRSKLYLNITTQYKKNKWRFELTTPINHHTIQIKDNPLQSSENLNQVTFEPRLSAIFDVNSFWKINSSINFSNQFGTINQIHYAYILQNYRNLQRINAPIPQNLNQNFSFGIAYRNPIKTLFWNVMYVNNKSVNNLLYQTQVSTIGATELQAVEQDNNRKNHNISTRASKYFSKIKSNITLNATFNLQNFQQLVNNNLTAIKNQNLTIGNKIDTDITDKINVEYQANWTFSKNKTQNQENPTVTQQSHILNLNIYPAKNQYFAIKSEYINNNLFTERTENIFTDLIYRYTLTKNKIDLEFQLSNLFNTTNYRTININDFSYVETNFNLRPRQALFKVRFTL